MNVWSKMLTALRGSVNEAGENIVDGQALRIIDQEVRDASEALKQSKQSLAEMMARQKLTAEQCKNIKVSIKEYESYALKALDQKDEGLALEVAQKIADLDNQLQTELSAEKTYASSVKKLKASISQTERNIGLLKQQVNTVKATASVQKAQMAVAERYSGSESKLRTAMDSLEKIKEKQSLRDAQMEAASELAVDESEISLKQKLDAAGITANQQNGEAVLDRLKAKQKK
jgi:phage shock protein A